MTVSEYGLLAFILKMQSFLGSRALSACMVTKTTILVLSLVPFVLLEAFLMQYFKES